jgi:cell division protein FtsL
MLKLLLCLISGAVIGVLVLQLRQQHLELGHQTAELHDQIRGRQAKLWDQQVQIAIYTAPNAIQKTVDAHDLKLAPQSPVQGREQSWIDVSSVPEQGTK